jgi:hypothetical protein
MRSPQIASTGSSTTASGRRVPRSRSSRS